MKTASAVFVIGIIFSACNKSKLSKSAKPSEQIVGRIAVDEKSSKQEKPAGACLLPWGGFILNGEETEAFEVSSLPCEQSCDEHKVIRRCENEILSGPVSHDKGNCVERGCPSCVFEVPIAESARVETHLISHGDALDFYSDSLLDCGQSCESNAQKRKCDRGKLTGDGDRFPFVSCKVKQCSCVAADPDDPKKSVTYPHGTELEYWNEAVVQCGSCGEHKTVRRCENGKWTGDDAAFTHRKCEEKPCAKCAFPGAPDIDHGSKKAFFKDKSPSCPTSCESKERTCYNGAFIGDTSYNATSCDCDCPLPGTDRKLKKGETVEYWTQSKLLCGQSAEEFKVSVQCGPRGLSANYVVNPRAADLANFSKWVTSAPSVPVCFCKTPWGANLEQGAVGTAVKMAKATCTTSCAAGAFPQEFKCSLVGNEMKLVLTSDPSQTLPSAYTATSCEPAKCDCTIPGETVTVPHGTKLDFWSVSSVQCGSCSEKKISRTCLNAVWSGSASFDKRSCTETPCAKCAFPGEADVDHGAKKPFFKDKSPSCPTACESKERTCYNGAFIGDTSFNSTGCDCDCPIPGTDRKLKKGEAADYWTQSKLLCGQTAEEFKVTIKCGAGGLSAKYVVNPRNADISGISKWVTSAPSVPECFCKSPWGENIPKDAVGTAVKMAKATCTTSCAAGAFPQEYKCSLIGKEMKLVLKSDPTQLLPSIYTATSCEPAKCDCTIPGETTTVPHGTTLDFWSTSTVQCGSCAAQKTSRTCQNAVWSGSDVFNKRSCVETPCEKCSVPGMPDVNHGESKLFYKESTPACPQQCESLNRKCNNGTFEGNSAFSATDCNCKCKLPGSAVVLDKGAPTLYSWEKSSLTCKETANQYKIATNCSATGVLTSVYVDTNTPADLSKFSTWAASAPTQPECTCVGPGGITVTKGASGRAYRTSTGTCASRCESATNWSDYRCIEQGGALKLVNLSDGTTPFNLNAFSSAICNQPSCSCNTPWGEVLNHQGTAKAYRTQVTECGIPCEVEGIGIVCDGNTGVLSSTTSGKVFAPGVYQYGACEVKACAGDGGGDGGGSGKNNGRGGNEDDEDLGGGGGGAPVCIPKYSCTDEALDPQSIAAKKRLDKQILQMALVSKCTLPWRNPPPDGIGDEFAMGGTISVGTFFTGFTQQEVECSDRCENHRVLLFCGPQGLTAPGGKLYPSCRRRENCQ